MLLWIIFAGLTAAALIAVLWPLLRGSAVEHTDAKSFDAAVFKDQIKEIDAELDNGLLTASEAESARTEVSRRLLAASKLGKGRTDATGSSGNSRVTAFVLCVAFLLVPVASSALYLFYGSPGLPDQPLSARLSAPTDKKSIEVLVAQVEARLREHPQDGRGWEVIAPVYMRQRRFGDAADAFGKSLRILGETPERLSDYGNALVLANDGLVTEAARKVLQRSVSLDAGRMRAWFWLAVSHEQDGDAGKAVAAWRDLLSRSDDNAPWRNAVEERLAALEKQHAVKSGDGDAIPSSGQADGGALKGPSREEIAAAREMSASDRAAMIGQMVAGLSERLRSEGGQPEEWKRLVRSYAVLGKTDEAIKALADARVAFEGRAEILSDLDALAQSLSLKAKP